MTPTLRRELEARVLEKVHKILEQGDHAYLLSLSRQNFLHVLAQDLSGLGLYPYKDTEAPVLIQTLLGQHAEEWRAMLRDGGGAA